MPAAKTAVELFAARFDGYVLKLAERHGAKSRAFAVDYARLVELGDNLEASKVKAANYSRAVFGGYDWHYVLKVLGHLAENETAPERKVDDAYRDAPFDDDIGDKEHKDDRGGGDPYKPPTEQVLEETRYKDEHGRDQIQVGTVPDGDSRNDRQKAGDFAGQRIRAKAQAEAASDAIHMLPKVPPVVRRDAVLEAIDAAEFVYMVEEVEQSRKEVAPDLLALFAELSNVITDPVELDMAHRFIADEVVVSGDWHRCRYPNCDAYAFPVTDLGHPDKRRRYCADHDRQSAAHARKRAS